MPSFNSQGLELAYDDEGEGEAVLLIHGFGSNAWVNWQEPSWLKVLTAAGYRVVAIDNRGHGRSAAPHEPAQYSVPIMAEDARALLDHLGIVQTAVMGYSMGALIATWLTLGHPERVNRLILGGLASQLVKGIGGHEEIAVALEADFPRFDVSRKAKSYRDFADRTKSDGKALAACMRSIKQPVTPHELGQISCPVLVVVGELDEVAGSVDELVALIPGSRGVVLPMRNHMNAVGDRGYKEAVLAFLEE